LICPGSTVEVQNVTGTGTDISYDISVSPGMPVTGNIIGPFPAAANGITYDVTVTASNGCGSVSQTQSVQVDYQLGFDVLVDCMEATFTPTSPCDATWLYNWDFGDGTTLLSVSGPVAHIYGAPGTYNVTLSPYDPTDPLFNAGTITIPVTITGAPVVDFIYSVNCNSVTVINNSTCTDWVEDLQWDFGDGTTITNVSTVTHDYSTSGHYTITLTASLPDGSTYTWQETVNVTNPVPDPVIDGSTIICCSTLSFSTSPGYSTYNWYFSDPAYNSYISGNGTPAIAVSPAPATSMVDLCVEVTDVNGCPAVSCITLSDEECCKQPSLDPENPVSSVIPVTDIEFTTDPCTVAYVSDPTTTGGISIASYNGLTSQHLIFNNDLIIDVNTTIINTHIRMASGHKIVIKPGVTVNFDRCTLQVVCKQEMWKGIILEDGTSYLKITNSVIKHAEGAITSNLGGSFQVTKCSFINNWVGILVNPVTGLALHPGTVSGSTFTTLFSAFPAVNHLFSPFAAYNQSYAGITLNVVPNIILGTPTNPTPNTYDNLQIGINGLISGAEIYNSRFLNIVQTGGSTVPTIHRAISFETKLIPRFLKVGGMASGQSNVFDNVEFGIHTSNRVSTLIEGNSMGEFYKDAIRLQNNQSTSLYSGQHIVQNNQFLSHQGNAAIYAANNNNSIVHVKNNNINDLTGYIEFGVLVTHVSPATLFTTPLTQITENVVKQCKNGIVGLNVTNIFIADNTVQIDVPNSALSSQWLGIGMLYCLQGEVANNNIKRTVPHQPVNENNLVGIFADNCMLSYIHRNTIERFGQGIAMYNACNNSRIYCNTFKRTWYGLYFNNAVVDDQGYPVGASGYPNGLAADNKWQNHLGPWRTFGTYQSPGGDVYYYRNGGQLNPNIGGLSGLFDPNILPASSLQCPVGFTLPWLNFSFGGRSQLFGDIVQGNNYGQYQQELRYHEQNQAARTFRMDTTWVYQGLPDDTLFAGFYQNFNTTACGRLQAVEASLAIRDSLSASTFNAAVSPSCLQEQNLKNVYDLYLNKGMADSLSASDTLALETLACSDPLVEGNAAYSAMAMLGKPYFCYITATRNFLPSDNPVKETGLESGFLTVYPNPANSLITVQSDAEITSIVVFDASGKQVLVEDCQQEKTILIHLETLPRGMYFLKVMLDAEVKTISISKQ
jgi:PKD repeat protein